MQLSHSIPAAITAAAINVYPLYAHTHQDLTSITAWLIIGINYFVLSFYLAELGWKLFFER